MHIDHYGITHSKGKLIDDRGWVPLESNTMVQSLPRTTHSIMLF
jgi:hypothetical protein